MPAFAPVPTQKPFAQSAPLSQASPSVPVPPDALGRQAPPPPVRGWQVQLAGHGAVSLQSRVQRQLAWAVSVQTQFNEVLHLASPLHDAPRSPPIGAAGTQ